MNVQEIARRSGVSQATVYRARANDKAVTPETLSRIEQAMLEMGGGELPQRKSNRRSSKLGIRTGQVAFMIVGVNAPAAMELVRGVEGALSENGLKLLVSHVPDLKGLPWIVEEQLLDGLILHGWGYPSPPPEVMAKLRSLPIVWAMTQREDWTDCVMPHNREVGRNAARQMAKLGLDRLLAVVPEPGHEAAELRAQGFAEGAAKIGVPCEILRYETTGDGQVDNPDPYKQVMPALMDEVAERAHSISGVFVPLQNYITQAHLLLQARGLLPGRDVHLSFYAPLSHPPTGLEPEPHSVRVDLELLGRHCAEQLLWRMAHPQERTRRTIFVLPEPVAE